MKPYQLLVGLCSAVLFQASQSSAQFPEGCDSAPRLVGTYRPGPEITSSADCKAYAGTTAEYTGEFGPFYTTPGNSKLCNEFADCLPGWYLHEGTINGCGLDNCCNWLPPGAKAQAPEFKIKWYKKEASEKCSQEPASVHDNIPIVMQGTNGDALSICIAVEKEDHSGFNEFKEDNGSLGGCTHGCCTFLSGTPEPRAVN